MLPDCPDHGQVMLDLALGNLQGCEAERAESLLDECPICRQWWVSALEGDSASDLARVVEQVFASFQAVERRKRVGWMPLAAAALIALAVALVLQTRPPSAPDDPGTHSDQAVLFVESFEPATVGSTEDNPALVSLQFETTSPAPVPEDDSAVIAGENLETGDLAGWSSTG